MSEEKKEYKTEHKETTLIDEIIEGTIIIRSQDGYEKHYKESEMRKQFAPAKATDAQWNYFKTVAQSQGLDPYDKDIYMSIIDEYEGYGDNRKKIGEKVVPLTGYLVYVKRSLASGKMKSAPKVEIIMPDEKNPDTWYADYSVERTDIDGMFTWRVWMKEVNKKRALWNIQPKFQLVKTTLSQGTRVWFSDVVGGFPYTPEEITQEESSIEVGTTGEGKVEPDPEEQQAKEQAKNEFLEKLMTDLSAIKTIALLEKKYTANKKAYNSSEIKDTILSLYASRKKQLTIELLASQTGFSAFQVESYLEASKELEIDTLIQEVVSGNKEAIAQLKDDIDLNLQVGFIEKPESTPEQSQEEIERELAFEGRESE